MVLIMDLSSVPRTVQRSHTGKYQILDRFQIDFYLPINHIHIIAVFSYDIQVHKRNGISVLLIQTVIAIFILDRRCGLHTPDIILHVAQCFRPQAVDVAICHVTADFQHLANVQIRIHTIAITLIFRVLNQSGLIQIVKRNQIATDFATPCQV